MPMRRKAIRLIIVLCIAFWAKQTIVHAQPDRYWKLVIDKNDIEVRTYRCANMRIRGYRATTTVNMELDSLEAILDNIKKYPDWQTHYRDSKVVHRNSDDAYHFFTKTKWPFPAKKKDLMWSVEKEWDPKDRSLVYDQVCSTNTLPERSPSGSVMQVFGSWRLHPVSESEIEVTYMLTVDKGGKIPNWLINMLNADSPFKILSNLRTMQPPQEELDENILD